MIVKRCFAYEQRSYEFFRTPDLVEEDRQLPIPRSRGRRGLPANAPPMTKSLGYDFCDLTSFQIVS